MQACLSETIPAQEAYGLFGLHGVHFVVSHRHIQSVLQCKGLTPLVHDSQALMGAIRHQGVDIPVVDMRRLMSFPSQAQTQEHFVLIVRVQQGCLGVLCDEVLDILSEESCVLLPTPFPDAQSALVFKPNSVHVAQRQQSYTLLDVECLLRQFALPWAPFLGLSTEQNAQAHQVQTCLVFELAQLRLAIPAECARATYFDLEIDAHWRQCDTYLGHATLENRRLPVLCLASTLGLARAASQPPGRHLVELEWGGSSALFAVDRVCDVLNVFTRQIATTQFKHHSLAGLVNGSFDHDDWGPVLTLNVDALGHKPELKVLLESFPTEVSTLQTPLLDQGEQIGATDPQSGLTQEYMLVHTPGLCAIPLVQVMQVFEMSPDLLCNRQTMRWQQSSIEVLTHADFDAQAQTMSLSEATHVMVLADSDRQFALAVTALCGIERGRPLSETSSPRANKLAKISLNGKLEFIQVF